MVTRTKASTTRPDADAADPATPRLPPMDAKEQAVADLVADFASIASDLLALHRNGEVAPEDQTACYRDGTAASATVLLLDEGYTALVEGDATPLTALQELRRFTAEAAQRAARARKLPSPGRLTAARTAASVALDRCEALLDGLVRR